MDEEKKTGKKPRVLFPYAEAGMGHVMPMRAIAAKFEEMYGDKVECVQSRFFTESGNEDLKIFERRMCDSVEKSNRHKAIGFFITFNMNLWGAKISTESSAKFLKRGAERAGIAYMEELAPDMVVSTHWSTNYYAVKSREKPLTVLYCPDAGIYPIFNYASDLTLIPTRAGYEEALKKYRRRFNRDNLKYVPCLIREEAFSVPRDKRVLREGLGLDEKRFTVVLAEGGYGIGRMEEICRIVLERDLPVTLIPVCGKNEELYRKFLGWKSKGKTQFHPVGFTERMLEYIAASDLFCGKSGANVIAEACFFGVPQIVTKYASGVEKINGEYYVNKIKTALKIFNAEKVADKIEEFCLYPERLEPLRRAAEAQREAFGAEECARILFALLITRFPELSNDGGAL